MGRPVALGITVVSCVGLTAYLFFQYSHEASDKKRAHEKRRQARVVEAELKAGAENRMTAAQALSAGRGAMAKGLLKQAVDLFSKGMTAQGAGALDSSRPALLRERAAAYVSLQQYELAVKDVQESTTLEPKDAHGWMLLGYSQLYNKQLAEAEKAYEQVCRPITYRISPLPSLLLPGSSIANYHHTGLDAGLR
jgi:Flp pilus assembly protein TadD